MWEEGERGPGEREGWRLATPGDGGTCPCPEPTYHLVVGLSLEVEELVAEGRGEELVAEGRGEELVAEGRGEELVAEGRGEELVAEGRGEEMS